MPRKSQALCATAKGDNRASGHRNNALQCREETRRCLRPPPPPRRHADALIVVRQKASAGSAHNADKAVPGGILPLWVAVPFVWQRHRAARAQTMKPNSELAPLTGKGRTCEQYIRTLVILYIPQVLRPPENLQKKSAVAQERKTKKTCQFPDSMKEKAGLP